MFTTELNPALDDNYVAYGRSRLTRTGINPTAEPDTEFVCLAQ